MQTTIQPRASGVRLAHLILRRFPDGRDGRKVSWWIRLLCKTARKRVKQTWDSSGFKSSQGAKYFSSTHRLAKPSRKSNVRTSAEVELQLCCDSDRRLGNAKTWSFFFFFFFSRWKRKTENWPCDPNDLKDESVKLGSTLQLRKTVRHVITWIFILDLPHQWTFLKISAFIGHGVKLHNTETCQNHCRFVLHVQYGLYGLDWMF